MLITAKNTNEILDFMDYTGIKYDHDRTEAWPVEHDSLKIALRPGKEYYNWYSKGTWGHLYDFVQEYNDSTFTPAKNRREATKLIKQFRKERGVGKIRSLDVAKDRQFDPKELVKSPDTTRLMKYLHGKRRLDSGILNKLIQAGKLTETVSKYNKEGKEYIFHNAAFLWRDHTGKLVGADIQGTNLNNNHQGKHDNIKLIQTGSKHDFGWNFKSGDKKNTDKLVVTEAPIDTISYYQLFRRDIGLVGQDVAYTSLSGASTKIEGVGAMTKDLVESNGNLLKELHFAVDNDKAGRRFIKKWTDAGLHDSKDLRVFIDIPKNGHKDWNEELVAGDHGKKQLTIDEFAKLQEKPQKVQINEHPRTIERPQPLERKQTIYR